MKKYGILVVMLLVIGMPKPLLAETRVESNVIYGMYSGLAMLMDIHYPENQNGYGIIFIRGSGWHAGLDADDEPIKLGLATRPRYGRDVLLSRGYTLFSINHRAAPRFRYPAAIEDAQRAVRYIRHHSTAFGINPTRIGAYGESSGGYLVSLLGVLDGKGNSETDSPIDAESSKVQAVVALYPATDLVDYANGPDGDKISLASFMGTRERDGTLYAEASPISHVSPDDPPFLLVHGDEDQIIPFRQSESFRDALVNIGVAVELIRMTGGGHASAISAGPNPPDFVGPAVNWFDKYLRE